MQNPDSFDPYAYVLNNPLTLTDPSGACVYDMPRGGPGEARGCGLDPVFDSTGPAPPIVTLQELVGGEESTGFRLGLAGLALCVAFCPHALDAIEGIHCCTLFSDDSLDIEQLQKEAVEGAIDHPKTFEGLTPQEIDAAIPADWPRGLSRDGMGIRYQDPARPGVQVIVYPHGYPSAAPNDIHAGPCIKVSGARGDPERIPLKGNPTLP